MNRLAFKFTNFFKPAFTYGKSTYNFFKPQYFVPYTFTSTAMAYFMYTSYSQHYARLEDELKEVETISTSELQDGQMKQV